MFIHRGALNPILGSPLSFSPRYVTCIHSLIEIDSPALGFNINIIFPLSMVYQLPLINPLLLLVIGSFKGTQKSSTFVDLFNFSALFSSEIEMYFNR